MSAPAMTPFLGLKPGDDGLARVCPYDFKKPGRINQEQLRTLQNISKALADDIAKLVSRHLRLACGATLASVDQVEYGSYMAGFEGQSQSFGVASLEPLKGLYLMRLDAIASNAMIERMFGAVPAPGAIPAHGGQLTDIEYATMEVLLGAMAGVVGEAWKFIQPERVASKLDGLETEARFCQIAPPGSMAVLCRFDVRLGEASGQLDILYPFHVLEPVMHMLKAQYWYEKSAINGGSGETVRALPLSVQLCADVPSLDIASLRRLGRGSVLDLPGLSKGTAWLRAGGVRVAALSDCSLDGDMIRASVDGAVPRDNRGSSGAQDPGAALLELKLGFESMKNQLERGLAGIGVQLGDMAGKQLALSDQLVYGQADAGEKPKPFSSLHAYSADLVSRFLAGERNQCAALVLSFLDAAPAARILDALLEESQPDIVRRLSSLDFVSPSVADMASAVLEKKLAAMDKDRLKSGGLNRAVSILNASSRDTELKVLMSLDKTDPELSESIKRNMFVFEDIIILDDQSIEQLLARADERDLVLALKSVSPENRDRVLARFPEDIRQRLLAAFDAMGRVRLSEAEAAGYRIVMLVRTLEDEGRITVLRDGD